MEGKLHVLLIFSAGAVKVWGKVLHKHFSSWRTKELPNLSFPSNFCLNLQHPHPCQLPLGLFLSGISLFLYFAALAGASPVLLFLGGFIQDASAAPRHEGGRAAALPYSTTAQGCLLKPAQKGCKLFFFSLPISLGSCKSHWENVQKRDGVFNNAIFVLDSVNSSHLPLLPSALICRVGLMNWFKCRFWTSEVASFFCWGISPSQPSLTLNPSSAAPRELEGGCWGCQNQGGFKGDPLNLDPQHPEFLLC